MTEPLSDQREPTFWNGEPCEARIVRVVVGNSGRFSDPWFAAHVGQEREAVEVTYNGNTFYIDNEGYEQSREHADYVAQMFGKRPPDNEDLKVGYPGWGWAKVTAGRGGPNAGHASLDVERVVE